jgi:hypothetical protein
MKKRKTNPKREKTTTKKESKVRGSQQQCPQVSRPSIATCMVLSTYHTTQETRYHPQYICENINTTKTWWLLYYSKWSSKRIALHIHHIEDYLSDIETYLKTSLKSSWYFDINFSSSPCSSIMHETQSIINVQFFLLKGIDFRFGNISSLEHGKAG